MQSIPEDICRRSRVLDDKVAFVQTHHITRRRVYVVPGRALLAHTAPNGPDANSKPVPGIVQVTVEHRYALDEEGAQVPYAVDVRVLTHYGDEPRDLFSLCPLAFLQTALEDPADASSASARAAVLAEHLRQQEQLDEIHPPDLRPDAEPWPLLERYFSGASLRALRSIEPIRSIHSEVRTTFTRQPGAAALRFESDNRAQGDNLVICRRGGVASDAGMRLRDMAPEEVAMCLYTQRRVPVESRQLLWHDDGPGLAFTFGWHQPEAVVQAQWYPLRPVRIGRR